MPDTKAPGKNLEVWTVEAESVKGWPPVPGTVYLIAATADEALQKSHKTGWGQRHAPGDFIPKTAAPFHLSCEEDRQAYSIKVVPRSAASVDAVTEAIWEIRYEVIPDNVARPIVNGQAFVVALSAEEARDKLDLTDAGKRAAERLDGIRPDQEIRLFQSYVPTDNAHYSIVLEKRLAG